MNKRTREHNITTTICCCALEAFMAGLMLSGAKGMEDDWTYRFDEEAQNAVMIFKIIGWVFVIFAVVSFIQLLSELIKSAMLDTNVIVACPRCGKTLLGNATVCHECGKQIISASTVADSTTTEHDKMGKENTTQCIFCEKPIAHGQIFCGHCGRRQD